MAILRERDGCNRRNVTHVDRADTSVANGRDEVSLRGDHRLECEKTLVIQVGTAKCEADGELADAPFDGCVIAKKANWRSLIRRELGQFHEMA